jgi:hypothetical protein
MPRFKMANELSAVLVEIPPVRVLMQAVIYDRVTATKLFADAPVILSL